MDHRQGAVAALSSVLSLSPLTVNFLRLLVDRQRIGDLAAIARAYRAMVDQQSGRVRATLTSARPLSQDELERLRGGVGRMTGRSIVVEAKNDPSLIRGAGDQGGPTEPGG